MERSKLPVVALDPRQAESLRRKERRRSAKEAKDRQAQKEAESTDKAKKSAANKRAYIGRTYNAKDRTCRHCGEQGHDDYNAITSCPMFCRYCEQCGHAFATCSVRTSDTVLNAATNADAKLYKVRLQKVKNPG
jgi:hypothetical protein